RRSAQRGADRLLQAETGDSGISAYRLQHAVTHAAIGGGVDRKKPLVREACDQIQHLIGREVSVDAGAETTDREMPVDAYAPYLVDANSAGERFETSDVVAPLLECLPSY